MTSEAGRIETTGMNHRNSSSNHQPAVDTTDRTSDQEGEAGLASATTAMTYFSSIFISERNTAQTSASAVSGNNIGTATSTNNHGEVTGIASESLALHGQSHMITG